MKINQYSLFMLLVFLLCSCKDTNKNSSITSTWDKTSSKVEGVKIGLKSDVDSSTIEQRFPPPKKYKRTQQSVASFGSYLRTLKLKPDGATVSYYDGATKSNNNVYVGVVDLEIGKKDLHQCADAVMRLRAEYFWNNKNYDRIHFNFTNGHKVEYKEWMQGKRMEVKGNKTRWIQKTEASNTYDDFWNYLELIFMYAGTSSLEKEMQTIDITDARIGDVLIQGGFPGHAVIIVDEAVHEETEEKIFMLAQSYMPAQEIQILVNPNEQKLNPWYELKKGDILTPEWSFSSSDIKRFTN